MDQNKLIDDALAEARACLSRGEAGQAAELCAAIVQVEPLHDGALHLLALIAQDFGHPEQALNFIAKAIEANPAPGYLKDCARICESLGQQEIARQWLAKADELEREAIFSMTSPANIHPETKLGIPKSGKKLSPAAIGEKIGRAVSLHQQNRLDEAERIYLEVLGSEAENADALHLLGLVFHQRGENGKAVELMKKAVKIAPFSPVPYSNLGSALQELGRVEEAVECYRKAILIDGKSVEPHLNLGTALELQGAWKEAEESYLKALSIDPAYPKAYNNLGKLLDFLGRHEEGIALVGKAVGIDPDYAEAWSNLAALLNGRGRYGEAAEAARRATVLKPGYAAAWNNWGMACRGMGESEEAIGHFRRAVGENPAHAESLNNLGVTLWELKRYEDAIVPLEAAVSIRPDFAESCNNLGVVHVDMDQPEKAVPVLLRAIELKPDYALAHLNLGNAYRKAARLVDALRAYERALEIEPDLTEAFNNLGTILQMQGKFGEAVALYERALGVLQDAPVIRWNLALSLLASGNLEEGWKAFESRWQANQKGQERPFPQPWWDGGDLSGKTLLLWGEQGVGDEIFYAGMAKDAISLASFVVIECERRLVPLFARSFPEATVIARTTPPDQRAMQADLQLPMASLARHLRSSIDSFPSRRGYLQADPGRVAYWRNGISVPGMLNVGICWRSSLKSALRDLHYSVLEEWGEIFSVPGVRFFNLQYDECRAELDAASRRFGVEIRGFPEVDLRGDLDEAAAITSALDLVISAPTAVAVTAGALGVPVWIMAMSDAWDTLGTGRYPWMPSASMYLRSAEIPWQSVLKKIASDLRGLSVQG